MLLMVVGNRQMSCSGTERHRKCLGHHVVTAHRLQVAHHRVTADQHGHLLAQGRVPWSSLMLNSILVHAHFEALSQATGSALVPVGLVHLALAVGACLAGVLAIPTDGAFEEASTAVAGVDSVVFTRAVVTAHFAGSVVEDPA